MHFLIILIAIAVLESNGQLAFIQRDMWVQKWHGALVKLGSSRLPTLHNNSQLRVLVFVLVPVAALQLVLWYLGSGIRKMKSRYASTIMFCSAAANPLLCTLRLFCR